MVDTEASKAFARKGMRVRVPPRVLTSIMSTPSKVNSAPTDISEQMVAKEVVLGLTTFILMVRSCA
jgi:hypothetical protein